MCRLFNVSTSSFYESLRPKEGKRKAFRKVLTHKITCCFKESRNTYGSPRITSSLNDLGIKVSQVTVAKIMKENNLRSIVKKKYKNTTNSKHSLEVNKNLLKREFKVDGPSKAWVSDITYIRTNSGWLYLTTIIDLFDRKVIGRSISNQMDAKSTVIQALRDAIEKRQINEQTIFHSDRGVQYASKEFRLELNKYTKRQSMSRKGNCWDNAVAESFFSSLKKECIRKNSFFNQKAAKIEVLAYIDKWYNIKRKHSTLGNKSPLEFEIQNRIKNVA